MKRTAIFWSRRAAFLVAFALQLGGCSVFGAGPAPGKIDVTIRLDKPDALFDPVESLGAGVDGHRKGETEAVYHSEIIGRMLDAGLHPLTYRLRTELAIEAWHWNPNGRWSDPGRKCGYWTSDADTKEPIRFCYGYRLPRRGDTLDEANNDGYSMLDDGDPRTFWKSNPYLEKMFTGEPEGAHPQWVAVDLQKSLPVNALRIQWAEPYATRFEVEYSNRLEAYYYGASLPGVWHRFRNGAITGGTGGVAMVRLCDRPVRARYLRIRLLESSGTALEPVAGDARDRLGYAIRELGAGRVDGAGAFHDLIVHKPDRTQTEVYASSTDPWHRECDLDPGVTQPGFDLVAESGLARGLPMMIPVPVFYDTPDNAAAEIAYLKMRKFPVNRIELGEEPDGQKADPKDYAALYLQAADKIRAVDPAIAIGGPSFVCIEGDDHDKLFGFHHGLWIRGFMDYLRARNRLGDFNFLSFEWYPFDYGNGAVPPQVARASRLLKNAVNLVRDSGVPADLPLLISEFGYSAFACRPEVDLGGALLDTEIFCQFLSMRGATAFLYGYEPGNLGNDWGDSWGNNVFFILDDAGKIRAPVATFHAASLLAREWAQPEGGRHALYPAAIRAGNRAGREPLVAAYPVLRPDGRWAVMLINKDPARAFQVSLKFMKNGSAIPSAFAVPFEVLSFSACQYEWKDLGGEGYPVRSEPAACETVDPRKNGAAVTIPPWSLTVLRSGTAGR